MGVKVDPPPLTVQFVEPGTGLPTRAARDFLHRLWLRTGGLTDAVTGSDPQRYQSVLGQLYEESEAPYPSVSIGLSEDQSEIITASADFTTTGDQVIICTNVNPITITLNDSPRDGERVTIKRQNGRVFVSGPIDGTTGKLINLRYSAPQLIFTLAGGEWSII